MKRKIIVHNAGLKLISVLVACLIWFLVMDNNDHERTQVYRNVPITIKNEATITNANKTFSVVDDVDKATVYVTARRSVRSKLQAGTSFVVKADLENYNEAIGSVPLELTCTDPSVSAENMRVSPPSLKIKMEDKIEESFSVVAVVSGKTLRGSELGSTSLLQGDSIRIAGPESLINIIGKITVPVDISGMSRSEVRQIAIHIEDKNGATLTDGQMNSLEIKTSDGVMLQDNKVDVNIEIWDVFENVPLVVTTTGKPASGYHITGMTLTPQTVNLTGTQEAFDALEGVLKLRDTVGLDGLSENTDVTIDINDTLAEMKDIRLQSDTASVMTLKLQIEEMGSKTYDYPVSDLTLLNVPKGKKLIFSPTDKLPINVRMIRENLNELELSDIDAELDLKSCEENGSYQMVVKVLLPEGYETGSNVTIVVNVADEETETEIEMEAEHFEED